MIIKNTNLLFFLLCFFMFSCNGQDTTFEEKQKKSQSFLGQIKDNPTTIPLSADFRYAAKKATPGVVHINATYKTYDDKYTNAYDSFRDFFNDNFGFRKFQEENSEKKQASASGVIVSDDGYIVTSNHVVDDADTIEVVLADQRIYNAKLVGVDPLTDLALLKIEEKKLTFIEFGNSDQVEVGDWVLAVGNPFNLASTVTAGIVSAKSRNINVLHAEGAIESFIQTDAAINPGNSGGALIDLNGSLIGINSAIATTTGAYAGYGFAVPVDIVKKVIDDLLKYGKVKRAYLGIFIKNIFDQKVQKPGVEMSSGIYVDSVVVGSAADVAGIKPKDIITSIDNHKISTSPELQEFLGIHRPEEKINITLIHDGKEKQILATLKEFEGKKVSVEKEKNKVLEELGVEIDELTDTEKKKLKLNEGIKVAAIFKGKIFHYTNIQKGFIITKVNCKSIKSKDEFIKSIETKRGGGIMLEGIYPDVPGIYYYAFGMD
jgi:serine protease Do